MQVSQTCAGSTTCPDPSRFGPIRTARGPGWSGPVRSFGPARSIAIRQGRPELSKLEWRYNDHPGPRRDVVVGAVDPGHIHTVGDQPGDELRILGGLARHGHHDPRGPLCRSETKELVGVAREEGVPFGEGHTRRRRWWRSPGHAGQKGKHGLDRREDVRFAAAQRRQPEGPQPQLEVAYVVVAQFHVVNEVRRRSPVRWVGCLDLVGPHPFGRQQGLTQGADLGLQFSQIRRTANITHPRNARRLTVNATWQWREHVSRCDRSVLRSGRPRPTRVLRCRPWAPGFGAPGSWRAACRSAAW